MKSTFHRIKEHLLKQGMRSSTAGSGCLYYGPNGTKCAVGCLIPADEYDPIFEGKSVSEVADYVTTLKEENLEMLQRLQDLHDQVYPEDWARELEMLEERYG